MMGLLFLTTVWAAELPGEELFVKAIHKVEELHDVPKKKVAKQIRKIAQVQDIEQIGNLPSDYRMGVRESTNSELIQPPKGSFEIFRGLKVGESIDLIISHSVIAFPDEKAPVVAISESGPLRGLKFIGESFLEPNSHRIFISFQRLVQGDHIFNFKGVGLASNGQPGFVGHYHSRELEYFSGDFLASFAAGYFDGLIPRQTNVFGQIETDNSVDTAVKKGLSSGALSTAERFRDKLKKVPEFSEMKGPFNLKVLILEQAKSNN